MVGFRRRETLGAQDGNDSVGVLEKELQTSASDMGR